MQHTLFYAFAGAAVILAYWLPRLFTRREPVASPLLVALGLIVGLAVPELTGIIHPVLHPEIWEYAAEFTVIVALFGTGLRIDDIANRHLWAPAARLLMVAMPITVAALALLGWAAAGLTLAGAILLGAAMAPTDPVLAGGVQVGKPLEGGEEPVRFALTTEAGLNDGLAFPFVHLAVLIAVAGGVVSTDLLADWSVKYVAWKIFAGVAGGVAVGWVVAKLLFDWPRGNALARTEAGVVGIAAVLLTYGVTELAQGYGFIAAFVAGVMVRRGEWRHKFNVTLHSFTETTEQVLTAAILVALGASVPALWAFTDWRALLLAGALVFLIRPVAGLIALRGTRFPQKQRTVMAFYGIRGVGSVYYLAYASRHAPFDDVGLLWATMTVAIVASTLVHGLTASLAVERAEDLPPEPERKEAAEKAEAEGQEPRAAA